MPKKKLESEFDTVLADPSNHPLADFFGQFNWMANDEAFATSLDSIVKYLQTEHKDLVYYFIYSEFLKASDGVELGRLQQVYRHIQSNNFSNELPPFQSFLRHMVQAKVNCFDESYIQSDLFGMALDNSDLQQIISLIYEMNAQANKDDDFSNIFRYEAIESSIITTFYRSVSMTTIDADTASKLLIMCVLIDSEEQHEDLAIIKREAYRRLYELQGGTLPESKIDYTYQEKVLARFDAFLQESTESKSKLQKENERNFYYANPMMSCITIALSEAHLSQTKEMAIQQAYQILKAQVDLVQGVFLPGCDLSTLFNDEYTLDFLVARLEKFAKLQNDNLLRKFALNLMFIDECHLELDEKFSLIIDYGKTTDDQSSYLDYIRQLIEQYVADPTDCYDLCRMIKEQDDMIPNLFEVLHILNSTNKVPECGRLDDIIFELLQYIIRNEGYEVTSLLPLSQLLNQGGFRINFDALLLAQSLPNTAERMHSETQLAASLSQFSHVWHRASKIVSAITQSYQDSPIETATLFNRIAAWPYFAESEMLLNSALTLMDDGVLYGWEVLTIASDTLFENLLASPEFMTRLTEGLALNTCLLELQQRRTRLPVDKIRQLEAVVLPVCQRDLCTLTDNVSQQDRILAATSLNDVVEIVEKMASCAGQTSQALFSSNPRQAALEGRLHILRGILQALDIESEAEAEFRPAYSATRDASPYKTR